MPTELPSDADARTALENKGFQFQPAESREPIGEAHEKYKDLCGERIDALRLQLYERVIIIDPFDDDHSARRAFLMHGGEGYPYSKYVKKMNKLSGNHLMSAIIHMDAIITTLSKESDKVVSKLHAIFDANTVDRINRYNDLSREEKIGFAKEIDAMIEQFLRALAS